MPIYRAQVVFQGLSGLAEDRFVNTFWFEGVDTLGLDHGRMVGRLAQIWQVNTVTPTAPLGDHYSAWVSPTVEVRTYDMADPEPRIPQITTFAILPGTMAGGAAMPEEVAIACTFRASPPNTPRRRGRVFIGPLTTSVLTAPGVAGPVRVALNVRQLLAERFDALATQSGTDGLVWVIRSAGARVPRDSVDDPLGALLPIAHYPVTNGWIDDALDTMRSRGPIPSARTSWS